MKSAVLLCLVYSLTSSLLRAQIVTPAYADVSYVNDTSVKHKMDVFIPSGINSPAPCVVHIHGGGFSSGQKGEALPSADYPSGTTFCDSLYYNGYVIADINYRLISDSIFPAPVYDCKTAIRFLKANASLYLIDTCKIGVIGESAGGYFACMLGTSADVASLEGSFLGSNAFTSRVQSVLDMYGITDFNYFDGYYPSVMPDSCSPYPGNENNNPNGPIAKFIGCAISACPDVVAASSVITYIDGNEPPFSIWHGTKDCTVPPIQSQVLYDSLIAQGEDAVLHYVPHGTHSDPSFYTDSFRHDVRVFFDAKLKNGAGCLPTLQSDLSFHPVVKIYPDPASDVVNVFITSPSSQQFKFRLFNSLGNEISSSSPSQNSFSFSVKNFEPGIYFYQVIDNNGSISIGKFLVEGK